MDQTGKVGAVLRSARVNATTSWILLGWVGVIAGGSLLKGDLLWAGFATMIVAVAVVPPLAFRQGTVMPPWEVLLLATLPLTGRAFNIGGSTELLLSHLSIAALALIIAVELHVFTAVRMTDWFAVSFVVVTTLATAGLWAVVQWLSDGVFGTLFIPDLRTLMIHFTGATVAGVGSGVLFTLYFRRITELYRRCCPGFRPQHTTVESARPRVRLRDRIGISEQRERQFVRLLQVLLIGVFFVGLARGNLSIIVNSVLALVVTQLPSILERDYQLSMDPGLVLWITTAVSVHAIGALGPYQAIWWWDNLAHALSSSVVAAIGYTTMRAISEHTADVWIPPRVVFVFILLFVVAAGVFWEVLEFLAGRLAAALAIEGVLIQYGLRDTMLDLVFDIIGGLIVAVWGTAYLTGSVEELTAWLGDGR